MKTYQIEMTITEIKPITVEVLDLQTDETVSSANITHTPPSGSALTISSTVSTPNISFLLGPLAVMGRHRIKVQAVGSAGSKPEVIYEIDVKH